MKRKLILTAMLVVAASAATFAQNRKALRLNEVMVQNESSIVDDYGERHGWIELFNSNFAPLEISSIYITNDSTDKKKYPVPLGDVNTRIAKRQHVVFFADGEPNKGTFHLNFVLEPGKDNWIGIYDADGITKIDEVTIPATIETDNSYARAEDGIGEWSIRNGGEAYITPSSANIIRDKNNKIEEFAERDKAGVGMTVMAMAIVFSALLVLCLCFYAIGNIGASISKINKMKAHGVEKHSVKEDFKVHDSGEEIAAIAIALHDHLDAHDTENTILTINKVKRAYSPWSSKIYSLREVPGVIHRR